MGGVTKALGIGDSGSELDPKMFQNPYFDTEYNSANKKADFYNTGGEKAFNNLGGVAGSLNTAGNAYNPMIDYLSARSMGQGPSLAQMQLQQATDANIANQAGIAASNPALNPAMAARTFGQNVGNLNQKAAGDAGMLRLNEQNDSIGQLLQARAGQGQMFGQAGSLYGNQANLGMSGGLNYSDMANNLAEKERQAQMSRAFGKQQGYESATKRQGEFVSKIGQGLATMI